MLHVLTHQRNRRLLRFPQMNRCRFVLCVRAFVCPISRCIHKFSSKSRCAIYDKFDGSLSRSKFCHKVQTLNSVYHIMILVTFLGAKNHWPARLAVRKNETVFASSCVNKRRRNFYLHFFPHYSFMSRHTKIKLRRKGDHNFNFFCLNRIWK